MLAPALRIIAILATGIAAGILFGDWAGATDVRPTLPAQCFIQFQQGLHLNYVPLMPILFGVSLFASAFSALLAWRTNRPMAVCFAIAALLFATISIMTRMINVPINEMLMTWTPNSPPADLWSIWQQWERSHTIRTLLALLAFAIQCVTLALHSSRTLVAARP